MPPDATDGRVPSEAEQEKARVVANYQDTFRSRTGAEVLRDLAGFAKVAQTSLEYRHDGSLDEVALVKLEGRREVVGRITDMLHMSPMDVVNMTYGTGFAKTEDDDG